MKNKTKECEEIWHAAHKNVTNDLKYFKFKARSRQMTLSRTCFKWKQRVDFIVGMLDDIFMLLSEV